MKVESIDLSFHWLLPGKKVPIRFDHSSLPLEILVFRNPEIAALNHRAKPKKRAPSYYLTLVRAVSGLTWYTTMNAENRPLVAHELVEFEETNRFHEVQDFMKTIEHSGGICRLYLNGIIYITERCNHV